MKGFYNGFFALGVVAGIGACIVSLILLEWFGFKVSASSGFLAALLGAVVGGSFTIAAQMMAADAAAKEAKNEQDEQSLKIEKAVGQSILLKILDYYSEVIWLHGHYSQRNRVNSLSVNGELKLAQEFPYPHRHITFSIEEKSACLEWKNHELLNGLNDLQGLSTNLKILHNGYSEKIRAYIARMSNVVVAKDDQRKVEASIAGNHEDDINFQELRVILEQVNAELAKALDFIPRLRLVANEEIKARFGIVMELEDIIGADLESR